MEFTTNADDQAKAAELKHRLASTSKEKSAENVLDTRIVPNVRIDEGKNKYVLISAISPAQKNCASSKVHYFVTSKRGAPYHRNVAEPFVETLEECGYISIQILGGGRIECDRNEKKILIYGFSYGFGRADHEISQNVVREDPRYKDFKISWSNEGY